MTFKTPSWADEVSCPRIELPPKGGIRQYRPGTPEVRCAQCGEKTSVEDEQYNEEQCPKCGHAGG